MKVYRFFNCTVLLLHRLFNIMYNWSSESTLCYATNEKRIFKKLHNKMNKKNSYLLVSINDLLTFRSSQICDSVLLGMIENRNVKPADCK